MRLSHPTLKISARVNRPLPIIWKTFQVNSEKWRSLVQLLYSRRTAGLVTFPDTAAENIASCCLTAAEKLASCCWTAAENIASCCLTAAEKLASCCLTAAEKHCKLLLTAA
jgi:hypothetical protein